MKQKYEEIQSLEKQLHEEKLNLKSLSDNLEEKYEKKMHMMV